ncbi:MAG: VWA domain-containing protein, partial [Candidatus Cloacimonadota bacterium]|nr:VWA domain-containing protein [Candidatus Cloacimonadota bacterium]
VNQDKLIENSKNIRTSSASSIISAPLSSAPTMKSQNFAAESDNLGFSTGGAKDVGNFRQNIENGYTPQLTDITVEGLFYDYFFDTGQSKECNQLFCPSYAQAISKSPIDDKEKLFMSVGLNSGIKESDFSRKKLNLVIVLDISGSMRSPFDRYYYDKQHRKFDDDDGYDWTKNKMEVAKESIVGLTKHLQKDDNFGVVLFNNSGHLAKPINLVGNTDLETIQKHIMDIKEGGGTNMEAGLNLGSKLFDDVKFKNRDEYENRIIFLTDAQPNRGRYGKSDFMKITRDNAENDIYTTFIGIGIDFNTKLVEHITKVKGANYFAVHNSKDFNKRMDDEFDFMVTPLVFDLQLQLKSESYKIVEVYGSPEADKSTNELMKINTLFPSKQTDGKTKGGLVLLELEKMNSGRNDLNLEVFYEDRSGKKFTNSEKIKFEENEGINFDNFGIRKGILLVNYVKLIKEWISFERGIPEEKQNKKDDWQYGKKKHRFSNGQKSKWEQHSIKLSVSDKYEEKFKQFKKYFEDEMEIINDDDLKQEVDILNILIGI